MKELHADAFSLISRGERFMYVFNSPVKISETCKRIVAQIVNLQICKLQPLSSKVLEMILLWLSFLIYVSQSKSLKESLLALN